MALLTTIAEKGQSPKIFNIPDSDLKNYSEVQIEESKLAQHGETVAGAEDATELEAASPEGDVQAYGGLCDCFFLFSPSSGHAGKKETPTALGPPVALWTCRLQLPSLPRSAGRPPTLGEFC